MKQYQALIRDVLENGTDMRNNRTGKICRTAVGAQVTYDLRRGFPVLTTRKFPFRSVVGELLAFFRGYTNAADFRALGCKFWDANANQTKAWLESPFRKGPDDTGRSYGAQWVHWRDTRVATSAGERESMLKKGYKEILHDQAQGAWMMERGINQLENMVNTILTDPSDRRIMLMGWRPDEIDQTCLPACHVSYLVVPDIERKELDLVLGMRSNDLFLGHGANAAEGALMLEIIARMTGYKARKVTVQIGNAHIYEDHFDQAHELLKREPLPLPRLVLSDRVPRITDLNQIKGAFERIEPADIQLSGYMSHEPIHAPMAI